MNMYIHDYNNLLTSKMERGLGEWGVLGKVVEARWKKVGENEYLGGGIKEKGGIFFGGN